MVPFVVMVVVMVRRLLVLVLVLAERVGEEAVEGEGVWRHPKALHQVSHLQEGSKDRRKRGGGEEGKQGRRERCGNGGEGCLGEAS